MAPEESGQSRGARPKAAGTRPGGAFLPALRLPQSPRPLPHSSRSLGDTSPGELRSLSQRHGAQGAGYDVLPSALDAVLDDHVASLALEDWRQRHPEQPGQHTVYESPVVCCEARLRKLDQLSHRLKPPNEVLTGVAYDLLRSSVQTLSPPARAVCSRLVRYVEDAIYSGEPSTTDVMSLAEVPDQQVGRLPHFLVVRHQQAELDKREQRSREMQQFVDAHLHHHRHMLEVMKMLHADEQRMLRQWLFSYWAVTFRRRRSRIKRMAGVVLEPPMDVGVPLASWKLYVSERRLERAKKDCEVVDKKASVAANRITEVEVQNETQQRALQDALEAAASLKSRCLEEKEERDRLQQQWDLARPELVMSVLAQTLHFFFGIVMRVAHFSGLELRQSLAGKDISPLVAGLPVGSSLQGMMLEEVLIRWVNRSLALCRRSAKEQLGGRGIAANDRNLLVAVKSIADVRNLSRDLADGMALCALFAALNARRDSKAITPKDLWPIQERDLELRASHVCGLFGPMGRTRKSRCLLDARGIASGKSESTSVFLACCFLQDPMLEDIPASVDAGGRSMLRQQLEDVISKVEEHAGGAAFELSEDPTPLLQGGDFQSLATTSTEQLLLRWVNVQVGPTHHRPVENFSSDLQDGLVIGLLLTVVAPEVIKQPLASDFDGRLDQVIIAATRCTDFELLTAAAIMDGQSDMLACFLAQLFLSRPNLVAKPESLLAMHLKLLEKLCREGLAALAAPSESGQVMQICLELEAHWGEFMLAAQTVQEANKAMQTTYDRMRTFLGETLVRRAQGQPRPMLDAKEAREYAIYTSLSMERLVAIFSKESIDPVMASRLEETLRKHFRLIRDIYQYYTASSGNPAGITLEGLLKLYQDCKLRCKDLVPHHLEVMFYDQIDVTSPNDRALSPQGFVEVLLQLASLRFRQASDFLDDQFISLIEQHLKPHACQETDSIFQTIAYEPKVRQVLEDNAKELKVIFRLYAMMDSSSTEAMQMLNTMNVKEFTLLLSHCDMLDDLLTEEVTQEIFDGIQDSATNGNQVEDEGLNDDDELAFTEFLDGLVAIAAYKFPDPFTPFHRRVASFVMKLFGALRKYWSRKRISPQVDVLLNVLQKRLR